MSSARRGRRHHGYPAPGGGQATQDVALRPVVHRHDVVLRLASAAPCRRARPSASRPTRRTGGRKPPWRGPFPPARAMPWPARAVPPDRTAPSAGNASTPVGAPPSRIRIVSARVSTPASAGDPARPQPGVQMLRRPPVRRLRDVLLHHQAAGRDRGGLEVLDVGADIADMGKGEGDDLAGVGGVGQGLLVAGHAGVEADLAHRRGRGGMGAEAAAPEHRAVGQDERSRRPVRHIASVTAGRDRSGARHGRTAGQIGQRQAGGGDDRRPVARGDRPGLAPLAHRLGAHAGQARGRLGAAQPFDDPFNADCHGRHYMGRNFPMQPAGRDVDGNFSPAARVCGSSLI